MPRNWKHLEFGFHLKRHSPYNPIHVVRLGMETSNCYSWFLFSVLNLFQSQEIVGCIVGRWEKLLRLKGKAHRDAEESKKGGWEKVDNRTGVLGESFIWTRNWWWLVNILVITAKHSLSQEATHCHYIRPMEPRRRALWQVTRHTHLKGKTICNCQIYTKPTRNYAIYTTWQRISYSHTPSRQGRKCFF